MITTTIRIILAVVFTWAGLSKLTDWHPDRLELPMWIVPIIRYIYYLEFLIALLLIVPATAWAASIGALVLLSIFTAFIARSLYRGSKLTCNCFGSSAPVDLTTLVSRAGLMALAAAAVIEIEPSLFALSVGYAAANTLILFVFGWKMMDQSGRLVSDIKEIKQRLANVKVPDFALPNSNGSMTSLRDLSSDGPLMLIFSSAACSICDELMPILEQLEGDLDLTLAVISTGTLDSTKKYQLRHVLIDQDSRVSDAYHVHGTPAGALIHNGRLVEPMRFGIDDILSMIEQAKLPKQAAA